MSNYLAEEVALLATIDPATISFGTPVLSDAIDCSKWGELMAVVSAGTLGASATLDAKFVSDPASGGSYSDVTGGAITQMTKAGSDDNKQAIMSIKTDRLADTHRYVKVSLLVGVANSAAAVHVFGAKPRYQPVADYDLASVDEIVYAEP
jgi:hypothetical protein